MRPILRAPPAHVLLALAALAPCAAAHAAEPIGYVAADGVNTVGVTPATPLPVATPTAGTISAGQARIAASGTAVQLPAAALANGVSLTANPANTAPIVVGGAGVTNTANGAGNGYVLAPGASAAFAVNNAAALYINGTAGDWVSYVGN